AGPAAALTGLRLATDRTMSAATAISRAPSGPFSGSFKSTMSTPPAQTASASAGLRTLASINVIAACPQKSVGILPGQPCLGAGKVAGHECTVIAASGF